MEFDSLPDIIFLRIFDYLSLTDRIRVGRVSYSFRRISQIVCARIKTLNLEDSKFAKLDANQFEVILRLCHQNLREITFPSTLQMYEWAAARFSKFTCPQLASLDLAFISMTGDEFGRIVTNHPKLERLQSYEIYNIEFPSEFPTLSNLQTLVLHDLKNDAELESLIDRCPNLKTLNLTLCDGSSEDIWDRFFRSVPRIESLKLYLHDCRISMENLEWFWRLPLTSLDIKYNDESDDDFLVNDDFIYKLVEHFVDIEQLELCLIRASDDGVIALSRLEKLRVASLRGIDTGIDDVIHAFSACRHLEELYVHCTAISDQTFLDLFENCPKLRKLSVYAVCDENGLIDAETIGVMLRALINFPRRPSITIEIKCGSYQFNVDLRPTWKSTHVQNVVQHLKQNHGIDVNLCFPRSNPQVEQGDTQMMETGDDQAMVVDDGQ